MAPQDKQKNTGLKLTDDGDKKKKDGKSRFMVTGSVIILIIVAVTFIGAPALSGFGSSGSRMIFGSWDGKQIEFTPDNYFSRQKDNIAEQYRDSFDNMEGEMSDLNYYFQLSQIWRQAFESTAVHIALISMAQKSGLYITEEQIDKAVINSGVYQGLDGSFDENKYLSTSNALKKSNRDYITESVYQQEVVNDIFSTQISAAEKQFIAGMASTEKKLSYVVFPYTSYPREKIIQYAQSNSNLFQKIDLSRIAVYDSEEKILEIESKLNENSLLFEELARDNSQDSFAAKGGVMGTYVYYDLKGFFDKTEDLDGVMKLKEGEFSDIIVNEDGWFIYRIDKPAASPNLESPEELEAVRAYIQKFERGQMEDYFVAQGELFATQARENGGNIKGSANEWGLSVHETEYFPLVYGNIGFNLYGNDFPLFTGLSVLDGDTTLQFAGTDANFLETASGLTKTESLSRPVILDEAVVVLKLEDEREVPEESLQNIEFYYTYGVTSWKEGELSQAILTSDKLVDNFYEEFGKLYSAIR